MTALGWLVAAYGAAVIIAMATAVANGHLAHPRYAFAAFPPFIVAVVACIKRLTPNRWLLFGLLLTTFFIDWRVVVVYPVEAREQIYIDFADQLGFLAPAPVETFQSFSDGLSPMGAAIGVSLAALAAIGAMWSYVQVSKSRGSGNAHLDIDDGVFETRRRVAQSTSDPKTVSN